MIDIAPLKKVLPKRVYDELFEVSYTHKINSPLRMAHFLSQCAHESNNFEKVSESLNYSANRLCAVFPKYFNYDLACEYERNPVSIASYVYGNRMGNGDEDSQEGWIYRGRGYIQLTGKNNYREFDATVAEDILENPDLVATKYPLMSAAWFWSKNKINELADIGASENDIAAVTKKVNGWTNGIAERTEYFKKYYQLLLEAQNV